VDRRSSGVVRYRLRPLFQQYSWSVSWLGRVLQLGSSGKTPYSRWNSSWPRASPACAFCVPRRQNLSQVTTPSLLAVQRWASAAAALIIARAAGILARFGRPVSSTHVDVHRQLHLVIRAPSDGPSANAHDATWLPPLGGSITLPTELQPRAASRG
jgi:hypothetical protein